MQISSKVMRVLREEQISTPELSDMLSRVAFTSVRGFNRRFFHWLFLIDGDRLVDMQAADLIEIGQGENRMLEEHEACGGSGCRACGWIGNVSRAVEDPTATALQNVSP